MKSGKNGHIWRKKKVLFHQNNASVHTCVIAMTKINELKFKFANNEEVETAVNGYFEELDGSNYKQGIGAIQDRWKKCIKIKGGCVKEYRYFFPNF